MKRRMPKRAAVADVVSVGGDRSSCRTQSILRSALFFVATCMAFLTNTHTAHAVSTGCVAVRGGVLNVTANDLVPDFVGTFEAGETVVWTFTGSTIKQDVSVTPPGGLLAVVGGTATFTFPTTGVFTIAESVSGTVTATCGETTPEKQAAVKNAVKTLTEMQRTQSLYFQAQILQDLTQLFLSGAVPVFALGRLEQQLAELEQKKAQLNDEANNLRKLINNTPALIIKYTNDIKGLAYITEHDRQDYFGPLNTLRKWGWKHGYNKVKMADLINANIPPRRKEILKQG